MGDFDTFYPDSPWADVSSNQRQWYDPILRDYYLQARMYNKFVNIQFDTRGLPTADSMVVTNIILPHGNFDPIGLRQMWMASSRIDSSKRTISVNRYGSKMALHKHDESVTYWQRDGVRGLKRLVNEGVGHMMLEVLENLARNAFLSNPYSMFGSGTGVNFNSISSYDQRLNTRTIDDIRLGLRERGAPFTENGNNLFCITSPGVASDMQYETGTGGNNANAFIDVMKYADPSRIVRGEVGTYHGVRFIETPRATLYNCGPITAQTTLDAARIAGDGVDPAILVDGIYKVGQASGINTSLSVVATTNINVGDYISIHTDRTSDFGVTNGADYRDGTKQERRVVAKTTTTLKLDKPIMTDFAVDLGSGVFGYITKARHVHTSTFMGSLDGVVMGVNQSPQMYVLEPIDDFKSMYRISWDATMGHTCFNPERFEVHYGAGTNKPGIGAATR